MEAVLRKGFGLGGIELERLTEVVGEGSLGGLFYFPKALSHAMNEALR